MRVAAFTKYDRAAASTRQRVLQYLPFLERAGIEVSVRPLLNDDYVHSLAAGHGRSKARVAAAYARRIRQLLALRDVDIIWVYAELFPWLPASFERLAVRSGKPLVYDFDDAFFHTYDDHPNWLVRLALHDKLKPLVRGASRVCAGNEYLRNYAERTGAEAIVLPTVVDVETYVPTVVVDDRPLTIGWIGSPSTWCHVQPILPLLEQFCRDHPVRFRAIGAGVEAERDRFPGLELAEWSEASEVAEVQAMDIGLMPLLDLPFQRGKSGYKLIQYMACGLPVIASPVGVNCDIVSHGRTGFLASRKEEWISALSELVSDADRRRAMGEEGRQRAVRDYSLATHAPRLVEVFRSLASDRRPPG